MKKIFRPFYLAWSIFWFLLVMFLIFPFVIIGSFFGRIRGGNFIYRLLRLWGDVWFFVSGIRTEVQFAGRGSQGAGPIVQQADGSSKPFVFVANHISNLDAAFLVKVIRQPFRALGKLELVKIPVFGFIYRVAVVTVDRSDPEHRARSIKNLRSIIQKGVSILIFPEGTFNETGRPMKECYDGAFRLAIETGTPIRPVIFPDTFARMQGERVFSLNPGLCRAIWLDEVPVEGLQPEDIPRLKQQVTDLMSSALRQYGASWIRDGQPGDVKPLA